MRSKAKASGVRKMLVPTDFSPHSDHALDYASKLARGFGARIVLIHVVDSLTYSVTDTLNVIEHRRALEILASSLLREAIRKTRKREIAVESRLVSGTPFREILRCAEKEKADLIVMGTHGRTGVEHLFLGSVAEKVVRLSSCPVLTVRLQRAARRPAGRRSVTLY